MDTNVLVRYLIQDHPTQSNKATRFLETNCTAENPGHLTLVVLCELVWVLRKTYDYPKSRIISVLEGILSTAQIEVESSTIAWEALRLYKKRNADFADFIICQTNKLNGCSKTITFDKMAAKSDCFKLI